MRYNSLGSNFLFNYVLIILYIITGSLPNFGAIDILAPQWIYLGFINLITCVYILFKRSHILTPAFVSFFKTYYIYIYVFYFIWNLISYFYAVNPTETLINLPRLGNSFFAIIFCYFLISEIPNKLNFVTSTFFFFLLAEMISYYYDLSIIYPEEGLRVIQIKGFAGNKNITAASIAFKIPFAIYFLINSKYKIFKFIAYLITLAGLFAVSLIQARAAILSSMIVLFFLVVFLLYKFFEDNKFKKRFIKYSTFIISPYLLAFFLNIIVITSANDKYKKVAITDTIGKISFTEKSSNGRFKYWSDAWEYIKENPFFSSGLGNWKIESIEKGKEHISGYTVPYHAHNDFVHVFAETGIPGGLAYFSIFLLILYYIYQINRREYLLEGSLSFKYFILALPIIVYGIDAILNFPVARPLMQSSLSIYIGLILSIYLLNHDKIQEKQKSKTLIAKSFFSILLILIIPGIIIHIISFKSLRQQGRLLYEFNNANYTYTLDELDNISHEFPNLTETAMPIKAMKARYYWMAGKKEKAFDMATKGNADNPKIHFGNNLKAQFFIEEGKMDSAYVYARKAFYGIPNNMPHFDIYMRTLVFKKDFVEINNAFQMVNSIGGPSEGTWTIYLRTLALTRSLGDPFSMQKAQEAHNDYPDNESIFQLYRILTYGQSVMQEAENIASSAKELFDKSEYKLAGEKYAIALDKDPLQLTYAINAGMSYFRIKDFNSSSKYFRLAKMSKNSKINEKGSRYFALSLISLGDNSAACAEFVKLFNKYPKRMYRQEFTKYCR